jgi:hypothetical protein
VLAVRDGCTSQNCTALAFLHDASRVRANLGAQPLDQYIERYAALWAAAPDGALADGKQASVGGLNASEHKTLNIDFPSAASIPAVSIMNPEPSGPVVPGAAAAAASNPNPHPGHRAQRQAVTQPAQRPVQLGPTESAAPEPIWPEPVPPAPPAHAAAAPTSGAPMPLNPPSPTAATPARTQ